MVSVTPPEFSFDIPANEPISFVLRDDDEGVDLGTVALTIDGAPVPLTSTAVSAPNEYRFTFTPTSPLPGGAPLRLEIDAADLAGRFMDPYPFTLTTDGPVPTPPPADVQIMLAGFLETDLAAGTPGLLNVYAFTDQPADTVEIYINGTGTSLTLTPEPGNLVHTWLQVPVDGLVPGQLPIELVPIVGGTTGNPWPYLTVGP